MTQPVPRDLVGSAPEGKDRRRWPRLPIRLQAFIQVDGQSYPCIALNFCQEGMFLNGMEVLPSFTRNALIVVLLSGDDLSSRYQLNARVVRQTGSGIGVQFQQPLPQDLFQWLAQLSKASASGGHRDLPSPDLAQLRKFILTSGENVLNSVLEVFRKQVKDHLIHCAERAESNADQTAFMDAIELLTTQEQTLANEVIKQFEKRTGRFSDDPDSAEKAEPAPGIGTLSLIDQNDFEDWLNMTEAAARLESQHQDALCKLEFLLLKTQTRQDQLSRIPLCPTFLGECFRSSLSRIGVVHPAVRKACYQLFFTHMRLPFDQAVGQARQTFAIDELQPPYSQPPGDRSRQPEQNTTSERQGQTEPAKKPEPRRAPIHQSASPGSAKQPPASGAGVMSMLNRLLKNSGTPANPDFSVQLHQIEEVLDSVDELPLETSDEAFLKHLQQMARQRGRPLPVLNSRLQEHLIVANRLTHALTKESQFAAEAKVQKQFERLRTPLLKLALRQPELFEEDGSPAIDLVNQIGKLEQWASEDSNLAEALTQYLQTLFEQLGDRS
ncbi:MAG TPA: DUF1631 family protein, partial [Methylothermaceae bacterium]|nr:DUF1631 family protein [Methylothermaceae bacterium]